MKLLLPGTGEGAVLKLPTLSLWGGVDPFSGRLTDPALPHCGESVKGRVLMIAEPVGSSSSSAVLSATVRPSSSASAQPSTLDRSTSTSSGSRSWPAAR